MPTVSRTEPTTFGVFSGFNNAQRFDAPGFVTFPRGQCADGGPCTGGAKHGSTLEFWWKQLENPMISPPLNPGSIDALTGYKHGNQTWLAPSLSSMVFSYRCQWLVRGFPSKPCS